MVFDIAKLKLLAPEFQLIKDVIIVGAGPVGLFAALVLEQRGLTVGLYERWPTYYPLPRACGVDHEIVRQLQGAGLAKDMAPLFDPVIGPDKTYEFLDQVGETLLRIEWNRPGASGWPQMNMFYQPDLERMLAHRLEASPHVTFYRGHKLVALEQDANEVELTFTQGDDTGQLVKANARYVIGADGARSTVCDLLGTKQTDLGFSYDWLVLDVMPPEDRVWKPYVVQNCDPARPSTLVASGPRRRRWEFMRLPGETIEQLNTAEMAWKLLSKWNITPENSTLERHTVYTFRGSWANQWKDGRVLLAGDAAHLMPPFLGQGLCAGMRDAMALGWRLSMILSGSASETVLDSYGPERSGHVQAIITQAVELGRLICMLDPTEVAARDAQMKAALRDPNFAVTPPPEPRLGKADGFQEENAQAGYLSVQGKVRNGGKEGLFDDVVGKGWQLLSRAEGSHASLVKAALAATSGMQLVVANFASDGDTIDLDGIYETWFARLGKDVVLVRPDFYIFGTAEIAHAHELVFSAAQMLGVGVPA